MVIKLNGSVEGKFDGKKIIIEYSKFTTATLIFDEENCKVSYLSNITIGLNNNQYTESLIKNLKTITNYKNSAVIFMINVNCEDIVDKLAKHFKLLSKVALPTGYEGKCEDGYTNTYYCIFKHHNVQYSDYNYEETLNAFKPNI